MQFYVPLSVNDIGDRHWSLKTTADTVKKVLELDNNLGGRHGRQKRALESHNQSGWPMEYNKDPGLWGICWLPFHDIS